MKFDGKHIGGKETGPVRFGFRGDEKLGQEYVPIARQFLGDLKRRMQLSLIEKNPVYQQEDFTTLPDGTVIYANSIFGGEGAADIDDVIIDTRKTVKKKKYKSWRSIGFVANAYLDSDSFASSSVHVKNPFGEDYEFLTLQATSDRTISGLDNAISVEGLITGTTELPPTHFAWKESLELWSGTHFYWIPGRGTNASCIPFSQYQGSVPPISAEEVFVHNTAEPHLIPIATYVETTADWNAKYQLSETRRNAKKHIAMLGKPAVTLGKIGFTQNYNHSFISVMPGKWEYIPDPTSWTEYISVFGTDTDLWHGPADVWLGEVLTASECHGVFLGDWNGDGFYSTYFSNITHRSVEENTAFTVSGAKVPAGIYKVNAQPDVKIWLLLEGTTSDGLTDYLIKVVNFKAVNPLTHNIHVEIGRVTPDPEVFVRKVEETNVFTFEDIFQNNGRIRWTILPKDDT